MQNNDQFPLNKRVSATKDSRPKRQFATSLHGDSNHNLFFNCFFQQHRGSSNQNFMLVIFYVIIEKWHPTKPASYTLSEKHPMVRKNSQATQLALLFSFVFFGPQDKTGQRCGKVNQFIQRALFFFILKHLLKDPR